MNKHTTLFINALELEVFLGWPTEERMRKQVIALDMEINLPEPPKACTSDHLDDTVCYHQLINTLRAKLGEKKFRLIEHITADVYETVKNILPEDSDLNVSLTKHPQIQGLGSVTFNYRDSR